MRMEPTDVLARALAAAENGSDVWTILTRESQISWRHKAKRVIRDLANLDWICVPLDEIEALEKAAGQ